MHVRRTNIPGIRNYLWQFHAACGHSSRCSWSSDRAARSQVTRLPPRKRLRLLLMDQVQNLRNQVSRPHHHLKKLHHLMDCNRQLFIHSSNKRIILYINSFLQSHFCMHFTTCVTSGEKTGIGQQTYTEVVLLQKYCSPTRLQHLTHVISHRPLPHAVTKLHVL